MSDGNKITLRYGINVKNDVTETVRLLGRDIQIKSDYAQSASTSKYIDRSSVGYYLQLMLHQRLIILQCVS